MDGTTRLFLLGAVRLEHGGDEHLLAGTQPRLVLVHAALRRGAAVPAEELAEVLWPAGPARHWEGALRGVVAKVRTFLGRLGCEVATFDNLGRSYRFEVVDDDLVDVWRSEASLERAQRALGRRDHERAAADAIEAAGLLDADLLAGVDEAWLASWRTRFGTERSQALRVAAAAQGALGLHGAAVAHARAAVALDPIDEESHRSLMTALLVAGNRGAALTAYAGCRRRLAEELGIAPSAATEDLYLAILAAEPDASEPVTAVAVGPVGTMSRAWIDRPFVGRRAELAVLEAAWRRAKAGTRQVVLLHGDAGVGKTLLAIEAVRASKPVHVLYGGSSPEQVIPFEPFAEALDRHVAQVEDDELAALLGPFVPEIVALVPNIAARVGDPGPVDARPGSENRSRIFEAVRAVLQRVAAVPTILVLDDLQWADASSLLLARHLVRTLGRSRLLVLATYRDDGDTNTDLLETLAALRRVDGCDALRVSGLSVPDVTELLRAAKIPDAEGLGEVLHRRTGGNGFYVSQVLAVAAEHPDSVDPTVLPESVVEVVRLRIAGLSSGAREVLGVAAVLGATSSTALLEATVSSMSDDAFDRAVEELVDRHLLFETTDGLSFAHAIVRDAVHDQLTLGRRRRLHLRAALAAERVQRLDLDWAATVARHYIAADDPAHARATLDATIRAAEQAVGVLAYEQAADLYGHAAATIDRFRLDDDRAVTIHLGHGAASRRCGDFATARDALWRALELARSDGRHDLFAEIVLELVAKGGRGVAVDMTDGDRADLLQEAVDHLPGDASALLVSLLAELALALLLTDQAERRVAAGERAEQIANESQNRDLRARAAVAHRLRHPGPAQAAVRRAHTDDLVRSRCAEVTTEQLVRLHMWRLTDSLELGDRAGTDRELAGLQEAARTLAQPYWLWIGATWEALHTFLGGDPERAEAQAAAALDHVASLGHPETMVAFGIQHIGFRLHQGRGAEIIELLEGVVRDNPNVAAMRCGLAFARAQAGATDAARKLLGELATDDFAAVPADSNWSVSVACLAETAAHLDDRVIAAAMVPMLEPLRDRFVVVSGFGAGGGCWGPFSSVLGSLWRCLGEPERARTEYDHALAAVERFGSPPLRERVLVARAAVAD